MRRAQCALADPGEPGPRPSHHRDRSRHRPEGRPDLGVLGHQRQPVRTPCGPSLELGAGPVPRVGDDRCAAPHGVGRPTPLPPGPSARLRPGDPRPGRRAPQRARHRPADHRHPRRRGRRDGGPARGRTSSAGGVPERPALPRRPPPARAPSAATALRRLGGARPAPGVRPTRRDPDGLRHRPARRHDVLLRLAGGPRPSARRTHDVLARGEPARVLPRPDPSAPRSARRRGGHGDPDGVRIDPDGGPPATSGTSEPSEA